MPRIAKPGQTLKQWCLTPVGFKDVADLAVLFRYVNNQALARGIEQIFSVCERDHQLLNSIKGFFRADVLVHLYVKPLQPNVALSDQPVFVDGIDL
jgi:hypothetical protein